MIKLPNKYLFKKPIILVLITSLALVFILVPKVLALNLGETINQLKGILLGQNYLQELTESEYLLEGTHPNFQAYFGDRRTNGNHRVRLAKDNLGFEFSFLATEAVVSQAENSYFEISKMMTSSGNEELTAEQKAVLKGIEAQIEEIGSYQATLGATLDKLKEEVESIDKVIQKTILGTDIGYDEFDQNQLVVKNSKVQPNLDVYYWKRENDLREKIIFRSPPAATKLVFSLKTEGLTAFDIGAGVIYFKDSAGNYIFRITKGFIKDLTGAFSNQVRTEVTEERLVHFLDSAWLSAPERVYPLSLYFDFQFLGMSNGVNLDFLKILSPSPQPLPEVTRLPELTPTLLTPTPFEVVPTSGQELPPGLTVTPEPTKEIEE